MGVGFSHCDAQWAYSGFHHFRKRLAKEIGIDLEEMQGFSRKPPRGEGMADNDRFDFTAMGVPGTKSWDGVKDPIKWLLHHSDCDGHLTPARCEKIAPRLEELVAKWPDETVIHTQPEHQAIGYKPIMRFPEHDKQNALLLAKGMRAAAKKRERLRFC